MQQENARQKQVEIKRTPVKSSQIISIGYDAESRVMDIEFKKSVYRYQRVPRELFEMFMAAESKGRFLHQHVKGSFAYEKLYDKDAADVR